MKNGIGSGIIPSSTTSCTTLGERLQRDGYRAPVDKNKWVDKGHQNFKPYVGVATTGKGFINGNTYGDFYVSKEPSDPPMLHKFREFEPDKHLNGAFIF